VIWERYLIHDDRNITVLTRVADAYRKVRDFGRSRALYLRALDIDDRNPYALIGLGHLHYDFKEYREALSYWEKMIEIDRDQVDIRVLTSIGNCYRKLREYEKGIGYFQKALDRDDGNFYALFGLSDCYRGLKQEERSLEYWNRILAQDPRNKMILTWSGDACRNLGQYDKAREYYERALNIEFDTYAVLGLARIAKAEGRYAEAVGSLRRLIQQDPRDYHLYLELAECCIRQGEKYQAVELLEGFQRQGVGNAAVAEALARLRA